MSGISTSPPNRAISVSCDTDSGASTDHMRAADRVTTHYSNSKLHRWTFAFHIDGALRSKNAAERATQRKSPSSVAKQRKRLLFGAEWQRALARNLGADFCSRNAARARE
jgi:hypothetical protein